MLFSTYGPVLDVNATRAKGMRGQAHIVFRDIQTSTQAMRALQGFDFFGKEMVCIDTSPRPEHQPLIWRRKSCMAKVNHTLLPNFAAPSKCPAQQQKRQQRPICRNLFSMHHREAFLRSPWRFPRTNLQSQKHHMAPKDPETRRKKRTIKARHRWRRTRAVMHLWKRLQTRIERERPHRTIISH